MSVRRLQGVKLLVLLVVAGGLILCAWMGAGAGVAAQSPSSTQSQSNSNQAGAPQGDRPAGGGQVLDELRKYVAAHENEPSETVFKNIQSFKGVPAGRLLRAMGAFTRSLGVNCSHCHVFGQWEKEDKPTKQVAREMMDMTRAINTDYIRKIKNLRGENPSVSCMTCHRGEAQPMANMQQQQQQQGGPRPPAGQPSPGNAQPSAGQQPSASPRPQASPAAAKP